MDNKEFSNQLCAWVDPDAVIRAALLYQLNPQMAEMPMEIRFPRLVPGDAKSNGLDRLIDKFLQNFELPGEYLGLLALKNPQVTRTTWDWIAGLRFNGYVSYSDFPPGQRDDTVVLLNDRIGLTLLVAGPIAFLVRYASSFVPLWAFEPGQRKDFFEPSAYGQLSVFIEYTVATALGHHALVGSAEPRSNATVMYGDGSLGFSLVSEPPFAALQVARELSDQRYQALALGWQNQKGIVTTMSRDYDYARPQSQQKSAMTEEDGFLSIGESEAVEPWRNVARWRNECSPYSILRSQRKTSSLIIDTNYGRVFDFPLEENEGIYGITQAMPDMPGSQAASGFLRTPYRKVPSFFIRSRAELDAVFNNVLVLGDGSNNLYRGQSREYALKRSANAREILYGDSMAIEPSLLASSVRSQQPLEVVLPAWCLVVRDFLKWVWENQLTMPELTTVWPIIEEDSARMLQGLDLHLYAISMAQHYGLPTMGLDVTEDINTALFFATHQMERLPQSRMMRYRRKTADDPPGVLYVFAPDERFRLVHDLARPRTISGGRPERQGAKFLFTGWGYHRNAVARHLGLALYLEPTGDFGQLPSARQLFPENGQDLFGDFLERLLGERELPKELRKYLEQLYWVVED